MPETEIARRGGAVKWRTVKLKNGRYAHVAVVKDPGPDGGHTVMGQPRSRVKESKPDTQPEYKIKPRVPRRTRAAKKS